MKSIRTFLLCMTCDSAYDPDNSTEVEVHRHPEPQGGPLRTAWLDSRIPYEKWIEKMEEEKVLFGAEAEKRRADQLGKNCRWLIEQIDRIHEALCHNKNGTWQQRVEQVVTAALQKASHE